MSASGTTGLAAVLAAIRDFFVPKLNKIENYTGFINYPVQLEVISAATLSEASGETQTVLDYYGNELVIPADKYFAELPNAAPCVVSLIISGLLTSTYLICKSVTNGKTTFSCEYNIEGYTIGTVLKTAGASSWTPIFSNDLTE